MQSFANGLLLEMIKFMDTNMFTRHALILFLGLQILIANEASALEVGQPVPACRLVNRSDDRNLIDLRAMQGQVVYVDFWASWCGPCAKSFPFMNRLHNAQLDKGLRVVAINVDELADDAEQFLKNQPAAFQVAMDGDSQCAKAFEVQAMPSTYLIDRKGMVRHIHLGFRESEADALEDQVNQLLNETP